MPSPSRHPPPRDAKTARANPNPTAPAEQAPAEDDLAQRLRDARAVWERVLPVLNGLDLAAQQALKGDLQLAALAALRVASHCAQPGVRAAFARLASVDLFAMADLDGLDEAAAVALYAASRHKTARATRSEALVPAKLDEDSLAVRDRMFSCAEHTLDDVPAAVRVIDEVRPGSGYLDRANDLVALAGLYRDHPKEVRLDGKKFREADEADAMRLAGELFRALGVGEKQEGVDWHDQQRRAWALLAARYREVRRWGAALFPDEADDAFPDLIAASRAPWGSRSRAGKTAKPVEPAKPAEPTKPA